MSTSKVRIQARPETVQAALTDSKYVKQWQYGSVLRTTWAVDSPICFTSDWEGKTFEQWGTVLAFDPASRLRYSLFAPRPDLEDRPENYFTMTYTLEAAGEVTVLIITQENPREPGTDQPADNELGTDEENPILDALKKLVESMEQLAPEK